VLFRLCPPFPATLNGWAVILLSLLLGAWSHNFWDAFTHERGWFVERIPWLQRSVLQLSTMNIQIFLVLQEVSTVVGFAILIIAYWLWLRQQPWGGTEHYQSECWRYLLWLGIAAVSLFFGYCAAVRYANAASVHGFPFFRTILFRTAIYAPDVAVPLGLIAATIIYARRPRVRQGTG
jgi:hypothetical protein